MAQLALFKAPKRELIRLFWGIGRTIVEKHQFDWGESMAVTDRLAADLCTEFPVCPVSLRDQVRLEDENPSSGIIVCRGTDRTRVEYTLRDVEPDRYLHLQPLLMPRPGARPLGPLPTRPAGYRGVSPLFPDEVGDLADPEGACEV